jgi:glutamine cyclotransferase
MSKSSAGDLVAGEGLIHRRQDRRRHWRGSRRWILAPIWASCPRTLAIAFLLTASACGPASQADGIPEYSYTVLHSYPHDPNAFTEGLFYLDGFLFEGTGGDARGDIRKVKLETGEVLQRHAIPPEYFGEGIVAWKEKLLELTWKGEMGWIYDLKTFEPKSEFRYPGEGWALTTDGNRIIMDDGTPQLRFWDPTTLQETGRLTVTADGQPVKYLNELEWVKGEIYANVWHTDRIARINPNTGRVVGWIDLAGLWDGSDHDEKTLNGIAYDAQHDRLFVTGKEWPSLFEIRLVKR